MSIVSKSCYGQFGGMQSGSVSLKQSRLSRAIWRLRIFYLHTCYHVRNKGIWLMLKLVLFKFSPAKEQCDILSKPECGQNVEVLGLRSDEFVEVKSEEEILATLDENKKNKGLLWMAGMRKFCGQRYRVFKRLGKSQQ